MRFDESYSEEAILKDGTRVTMRLVRPDDAPLLQRAFEKLSPHSRYTRFFAAKKKLTHEELDYLTHVDGTTHVAIGALLPDGEGAGIARFIAVAPETAEAAVTVLDALQGKGLGKLLLSRLAGAARERGITHFRADVLATNDAMLGLAKGLGSAQVTAGVDGVTSIDVALKSDGPASVRI